MRSVDLASVQGEAIMSFDSTGFAALAFMDRARVTVCRLEAGGCIGAHKAPVDQLFVVISGSGVVSAGSTSVEVASGQSILFESGDEHVTASSHGLSAVIIESPGIAEQF